MSDDDLDLLEGDLWRSQGQKHGLIINVGPHRQWPYSENTSGNGNLDQSGGYGNSDMILAEKHEARMAFTNHANHIYLGPSDDALRVSSLASKSSSLPVIGTLDVFFSPTSEIFL